MGTEQETKVSNIIYQKIVGTFPQLDRDVVVALSEEIAQAIPQPLDDKELREKIIDLLCSFCEEETVGECCWRKEKDICEGKKIQADQILALLQPKIEEAFRKGQDEVFALIEHLKTVADNLSKNDQADKYRFADLRNEVASVLAHSIEINGSLLEEARRQERERILAQLPKNPWVGKERGCNPDKRVAVDIILGEVRQALKGGE